jgi:molybdenum cofactor cytidylyltransferase
MGEAVTDAQSHLAGLVLAAGAGARFAGPKQLARLGHETLVERAARLAADVCGAGVVVVTGAHAEAVAACLATTGVQLAFNPAWESGMSGSIVCGLAGLPPGAQACMILLCDQPAIDAMDLHSLVSAWAAAPQDAAAAAFAGVLGAPAIFPAALWPQLRSLTGDRGARAVLHALARVTAVPMAHAALDVDTAADLEELRRR